VHAFDCSPVLIALFPLPDGIFRLVSDQVNVLEKLPDGMSVREVLWQSRFRISHRQVASYQKGNVFLAGDSAHIHSPVGGRGMNLGIEDAAWLAWLIEKGETERYTALRHPVGKRILEVTTLATRLVSSDFAPVRFLRRHVLPLIARRAAVQRLALPRLAGLTTPHPPWL
jgi:2-polyprenyl-6-methoxyphenol hydroxylase-like FAD-dependent oxidoreductase